MLHRGIRVAAALAAVAMLAGCSAGGEGGDGRTQVTVWTITQTDQAEAWKSIISEFESEHPDIEIVMEERGTDAHKEALRRSAGTDSGPDVYFQWTGVGLGGELVEAGVSADLSEYATEYGWEDRFTPAALAAATQYGGFHGVPWTQQGMAVYYDRQVFDELGLEIPTSYDEFRAVAEEISAAGLTPMSLGGTVNWHLMRLIDSQLETFCGADTFDALINFDVSWADEPCVSEAFSEFHSWQEFLPDGFMGMSNSDVNNGFMINGQNAMTIDVAGAVSALLANGVDVDRIGVFRIPTGTDRLYSFGEAYYVSEASDVKDEAVEFLDFITSDEILSEFGENWSPISVNRNVQPTSDLPTNAAWAEILETSTGVYGPADQNFNLEVATEFFRIQNAVMIDEIAPEDAGTEFQTFIDNLG